MNTNTKRQRQKRVRATLHGTSSMPRLSVYRSGRYIYAQIIDDEKRVTVLGVSEKALEKKTGTKTEKAKQLGMLLAEKAQAAKVKKVVFDRGAYRFHGRVKALAEGAREGGLVF